MTTPHRTAAALFVLGLSLAAAVPLIHAGEIHIINLTNQKSRKAPPVTNFTYQDTLWLFFDVTDFDRDDQGQVYLVQSLKIADSEGNIRKSFPALLIFHEKLPDHARVVNMENFLRLNLLRDDLPPGDYRLLISVHDRIRDTVTLQQANFSIVPEPTGFRLSRLFFASGPEGPPREPPVYAADEIIWLIVQVRGFQRTRDGRAHLIEDFYLYAPDDSPILQEPGLVTFDDTVEAEQPVVFRNHVQLQNAVPGTYRIHVVVTDRASGAETARYLTFKIASDP